MKQKINSVRLCKKICKQNHVLYFQEHVWDASHYLVRLVFSGLKEMFTGTREIQVGSLHLHDKTNTLFSFNNLPPHTCVLLIA